MAGPARGGVVEKALRRPWRDNLLAAEAFLAMAVAAALIAFVPFRRVAPLMDAKVRGSPPDDDARKALVSRVRWAVLASARRAPWRTMCFEQGLTAHWMLRRRGVPTLLHYGVARSDEGQLEAHVWVRDSGQPVTGCEVAPRFTQIAVFPDPSRQSA